MVLTGLAVPWSTPTHDRAWAFRPGAFARCLGERRVVGFEVNHGGLVLARDVDGSLDLWEAADGLAFRARISSPAVVACLRAGTFGEIRGMSPRWRTRTSTRHGGLDVITAATLEEISLITGRYQPRFPGTWVQITENA